MRFLQYFIYPEQIIMLYYIYLYIYFNLYYLLYFIDKLVINSYFVLSDFIISLASISNHD